MSDDVDVMPYNASACPRLDAYWPEICVTRHHSDNRLYICTLVQFTATFPIIRDVSTKLYILYARKQSVQLMTATCFETIMPLRKGRFFRLMMCHLFHPVQISEVYSQFYAVG